MVDLIYESRIEREIPGNDNLSLEAWATGREDDRGEISLVMEHYEAGRVSVSLSPSEARQMAAILVELADKAERLSTRGYVGSKELQ